VDLDADLKGRIEHLKQARDIARASLERLTSQAVTSAAITPQRIAAFADLMREKLRNGDTHTRKAWIGSLITRIEVDDDRIRVIGETPVLAAAVIGQSAPQPRVRGFVRNWRTRQDSNLWPLPSECRDWRQPGTWPDVESR
jgi:site-specific DNA recombinase